MTQALPPRAQKAESGVQRARKSRVQSPAALAALWPRCSLSPLEKRAAWRGAWSPGEARASPPSTFCAVLTLFRSGTASRPGPLSPAFLCRDCSAYSERTQESLSFRQSGPLPPALAASWSGSGAWELTAGRGGEEEANPGTWAAGRVQVRVAAGVNEGSRPGAWRRGMGRRPSDSGRPRRSCTFRGLRCVPVKSAESFTSQLLQRAQRRRGPLVRLWRPRHRGSSGNLARA